MASSQNSSMKPYSLTWCFMSLLSLVPLILPVLIVSSHVPLVFGRCREDQQSLLVQLKGGLNFTDSISVKLARWNVSTDCCEWPGISCDVGGLGRVIGLDLSGEWINGGGGLDDSMTLFSLQYLERLDLSYNEFNTTIPAALANLTNLRYMDLSNADFFGKIPASISQLTSLTSLNLSCWVSCVKKLEISNLALLVQNLTQLTHLRLDGVNLSAQGNEWGHVLSSSLLNLEELSLSTCSLSGPLDPSLSKLQSLSLLNLHHNNFSSLIPDSLAELKNLTTLRMANCGLIGTFPKKIAQSLTLLEYLDLSNNQLQDLKKLSVLDLRGNMLTGKIPDTFQTSSALQTLDLSNNQLQGRIPESLENCTMLEVLDVGHNKISDVFPCIQGIKSSLRVLILRNNLFHGSLWCPYGDSSTWQQLQIVDLAFNNFSGPLNDKFLDTWEVMKDGNETHDFIHFQPSVYGGYYQDSIAVNTKGLEWEFEKILTIFKSIDLSSNNFDGPIPEIIGKFKALHVLNLSHNAFTGNIPSVIGDLSNLESLDLSYNKLSGHIPMELVGLTFLAVMNLSDNYLVGSIPTGRQFQTFENTSFGGKQEVEERDKVDIDKLKTISRGKCSHVPLVSGRCREDQQSLLLELKGGLNLTDSISIKLTRWDVSTDCCEWPGISCDPGGLGRVIGLDLNSEGITGGKGLDDSTALFGLQYLERLDLSYNRFNTTIPAAIGNLTNLRYLDLSFAGFFGQIPTSISQLTSLTSLNLTFGVLKLENPSLALFVQNLTQLTDLRLNGVDLSSQRKKWCHVLSSSLPNLKVLSLFNCSLSGPLDPSFSKLQSLSILELDYNNFSSPLPDSLAEFKNLTYLSMKSCGLIGTFSKKIAQSLTLLETLDLSNNQLQGPIPRSIFELPSLRVLFLSSNRFRGSVQLSWIHTLQNLTWLDLSYNNLTVEANINNSSPLSTFPQLEYLYIRSCNLRTFPELGNLSELSELDLSDNNINGVVPRLEVVDFSNNYLNGTIPSCLSKDLNELSVLDLRRNMLSGNILNTFQVSCALQTLDLSNNQLEGIFPESLENCTNLEVLDIGYNKISDVFPCIQGIKSSLHVLILRNNLFHGSLWCRYGDLTTWQQLQIVDLAFNNFTEPLNDKFLLTWEAMMQDGKGTKDRIKFNSDSSGYYHNSITVSMKGLNLEFVKILTVFKSIDLSSNNFVGPIPEVIGKFKAIQVLNLSHNAFSGQIPSEFGNLSNVESLDLSHNKLTGQIPNELTGLTFLSCMDLSYNNLVGRIPTGTQFQSFDNTSFGGNLDLCGQPLSKSCTDPPTLSGIIVSHEKSSIRINWDILSKVFGFFCGLALIMLPASLWPSFRIWYWPKIDSVILWMFPKLYVKDWNNRLSTRQTRRRNKRTKAT
ncbi:Receptor-like protein 12 [Linum perenne]